MVLSLRRCEVFHLQAGQKKNTAFHLEGQTFCSNTLSSERFLADFFVQGKQEKKRWTKRFPKFEGKKTLGTIDTDLLLQNIGVDTMIFSRSVHEFHRLGIIAAMNSQAFLGSCRVIVVSLRRRDFNEKASWSTDCGRIVGNSMANGYSSGNSNILGIFTPRLGEDEPILTSILFRWVETTNQMGTGHSFAMNWQILHDCGWLVVWYLPPFLTRPKQRVTRISVMKWCSKILPRPGPNEREAIPLPETNSLISLAHRSGDRLIPLASSLWVDRGDFTCIYNPLKVKRL